MSKEIIKADQARKITQDATASIDSLKKRMADNIPAYAAAGCSFYEMALNSAELKYSDEIKQFAAKLGYNVSFNNDVLRIMW